MIKLISILHIIGGEIFHSFIIGLCSKQWHHSLEKVDLLGQLSITIKLSGEDLTMKMESFFIHQDKHLQQYSPIYTIGLLFFTLECISSETIYLCCQCLWAYVSCQEDGFKWNTLHGTQNSSLNKSKWYFTKRLCSVKRKNSM